MAFTFVHTADWQIGKPFGRFPDDISIQLKAQRVAVIDRIAAVGRANGARHVLVAGDVFDSEHLEDQLIRQALGRLGLHGDLIWHLLPGNHDPCRSGGVWDRIRRLGLPVNVVMRLEPTPVLIEPSVALLPAPLTSKQSSRDPTAWMDQAETPVGAIRLGLAHGSVQGFGSLGEAAVPIDPRRRRTAGLAFMALGDWHGAKQIEPGTWYSGAPEPDGFLDNGAGHVLVVTVDGGGGAPVVKGVRTGHYEWRERRLKVRRLADLQPVVDELDASGAEQVRMLVSLAMEGSLTGGEQLDLEAALDLVRSRVFHLEVDHRRLETTFAESDFERLGEPALSALAARLETRSRDSGGRDARVASRAMSILLSLAVTTESRKSNDSGCA